MNKATNALFEERLPKITFTHIFGTVVVMVGIIGSSVVWSWVHDDEEEDHVRFRQRLVFAIFWLVVIGLSHIKNLQG